MGAPARRDGPSPGAPHLQRPRNRLECSAGSTRGPIAGGHGLTPDEAPLSTQAPPKVNGSRPPTRPIGASGTRNFGGFIQPEELNREWVGQALYRTVDRMVRTDPVVRAALSMVMLPIAEAEWTVEAASADPEDAVVAEFVRRALLEHLDWRKVVWQAIPARYGHAVLEETYEPADWALSVPQPDGEQDDLPTRTYWVPAAYQPRLGRTIWRWMVDSTGRLESIIQQRLDPMTGQYSEVEIPTSQLVVIVNEQEGDDYTGVSVQRSA